MHGTRVALIIYRIREKGGYVSDQVIRYATEEEYIEYTNHRRYLATGKVVKFPDWKKDPDAYWKHYYDEMAKHHACVFEMWTILHKEQINRDTGALISQHCTYDTLAYDSIEEGRVSRKLVKDREQDDPGFPVSAEFKSSEEAERMRALLMKGEPGYYYDIKHRTGVAVIDREKTGAE
jgi:hypothetical protein